MSLPFLEERQLRKRVTEMKQLPLWITETEPEKITIDDTARRQEVVAIMAEAIIAVVQEKKEEKDEHLEESQGPR
jgi:hypothetical protein